MTATPVTAPDRSRQPAAPPPVERRPTWEQVALYLFVVGPFLAVIAGVVLAIQGHLFSWLDAVLGVFFFALTAHGITIGFHRHFTHGSFKARRGLRLALAFAGSMAVEGPVIRWVADHRKHHAFADAEGDPHSPWRFGTTPRALAKGLWWAHTGWLFDREQTSKERYAPDLCADADMVRMHKLFPVAVAVSLLAPPAIVYAVTLSPAAAGLAFLWVSLVRIFLVHHTTWSVNSICHVWGERPFDTRDKATNVWPLAILSMGESWHNLHHADPTCARHGVDPHQIDSSARLIALFEYLGWAWDVRWPKAERLDRRRVASGAPG